MTQELQQHSQKRAKQTTGGDPAADEPAADACQPLADPSSAADEPRNSADGNNSAATYDYAMTADEPIDEADTDPPQVKLGYCSFSNGMEARSYISNLLRTATLAQPLQEYELALMLDVLAKGHPYAQDKLSHGVKAILVAPAGFDRASVQHLLYARSKGFPARLLNHTYGRRPPNNKQKAFYMVRLDGVLEDFSYLLCLRCLFARDAEYLQAYNGGKNSSKNPKGSDCTPRGHSNNPNGNSSKPAANSRNKPGDKESRPMPGGNNKHAPCKRKASGQQHTASGTQPEGRFRT